MARFDDILGIHEQALSLRSQRIDLLSQNIANAQTPGFKARDLDFKSVLASATGDALQTTHHQHFSGGRVNRNYTTFASGHKFFCICLKIEVNGGNEIPARN